jgi:hypothetical protein
MKWFWMFMVSVSLLYLVIAVDAQNYVRVGGPNDDWTASLAGVGATLTELKAVPAGANQYYNISQIVVQSTTGTINSYSIQSGTGANCGTATTAVFPKSATTDKWNGAISTAAPIVINFPTPIHVTRGHAICVLGIATQLTRIEMIGFTSN